jgi:hypothetical protein
MMRTDYIDVINSMYSKSVRMLYCIHTVTVILCDVVLYFS